VARAVILCGLEIGSRAGVVEVNLMVIISRLKKTKQGTSFLKVPALLYFDLKTGWYFRILNTYLKKYEMHLKERINVLNSC
jgi:hypothetical protein